MGVHRVICRDGVLTTHQWETRNFSIHSDLKYWSCPVKRLILSEEMLIISSWKALKRPQQKIMPMQWLLISKVLISNLITFFVVSISELLFSLWVFMMRLACNTISLLSRVMVIVQLFFLTKLFASFNVASTLKVLKQVKSASIF